MAALAFVAAPAAAFEVQCGSEGGDAFGWAIASGHDFNDDGTADVAIGAPCAWVGSSIRAGRVRVYSGKNDKLLLSLAGSSPEEKLGSALAWLPDLDGDEKAELVIGSATYAAPKPVSGVLLGAGKVEVRSSKGHTIWTVYGPNVNASFGETLDVIPDVDGDGKSDVVVGASGAQVAGLVRGAGYLLSGASGAEIARTEGEDEGDQWASLVGLAGDVDDDGIADWFASSRVSALEPPPLGIGTSTTTTTTMSTTTTTLTPRAGRLEVFSGKPPYDLVRTYVGETIVDRLGRAAVPAGDVDDDGLGDLWIGSPGAEPNELDDAGAIGLYAGSGDLIRQITEPLPQQSSTFGTSLAVPGDLDTDGLPDVVAGAPFGRVSGMNQAGRLHAFSTADGDLLWSRSGTRASERLGQTLELGIDADGDGIADLLVGAPGHTPNGKRGAGSVFVLSSMTGDELKSFEGRRGRETRVFVAGLNLSRDPVVRGYDPLRRRREAEIRPFRGQRTSRLSLGVLRAGRREETQNGTRTLLVVGSGDGATKPEVTVHRANRRKQRLSRFLAGPNDYAGGVNVAGGDFSNANGEEIAVAPTDASGGTVWLYIYDAFPQPQGPIDWEKRREIPIFAATDKFNDKLIEAVGATVSGADLTSNDGDELVVAPAAGLPVVRVFGRAGTKLFEWQAYPSPGSGVLPNSGVSTAIGNLDGNGPVEIVTAPLQGQPWVRAWRSNGTAYENPPGSAVSFIVSDFGPLYAGGLTITTADVDFDGNAEILVAPGAGVVGRILAFEADAIGTPVEGWAVFEPFGPMATGGLGLFGLDQFWRR